MDYPQDKEDLELDLRFMTGHLSEAAEITTPLFQMKPAEEMRSLGTYHPANILGMNTPPTITQGYTEPVITWAHELFHHFHEELLTPQEKDLLEEESARRGWLNYGGKRNTSEEEVIAEQFGQYAVGEDIIISAEAKALFDRMLGVERDKEKKVIPLADRLFTDTGWAAP